MDFPTAGTEKHDGTTSPMKTGDVSQPKDDEDMDNYLNKHELHRSEVYTVYIYTYSVYIYIVYIYIYVKTYIYICIYIYSMSKQIGISQIMSSEDWRHHRSHSYLKN